MEKSSNFNQGKVYQGGNLLQIAMPLGGIGTGCICLNGFGGLQDFSIRHNPVLSAMPDRHLPLDSGFAILHLPENQETRLVEGPFPPEKIYNLGLKSQGYNGGGCEGLPRFRNCTFKGEYPFGEVRLDDPDLPLEVTITGFNPLIPLDEVNSGIPCAILEYRLTNKTKREVPYQFSYHLSHLAQKGAEIYARSEALPGLGISYWNEAPDSAPVFGSAAFGILDCDPLIKARWLRGHFFDPISALWRELSTGTFHVSEGVPAGSKPALNGGSLLVKGSLKPGESVLHPVVIAWYFPNFVDPTMTSGTPVENPEQPPVLHPFYATQWKDAKDILLYMKGRYQSLRDQTQAFHDALFATTLPGEVLEAVSANLGIMKSPTVLRFDNGDLWGWEGCFCDRGSCPGSCTHVWNYAQSIPHLFPNLERTLRQRELESSMDENGHINFRSSPPGYTTKHDFHAAADGQLGGIMKVYREWQICGDRHWLERIYPFAKRSIDFCIQHWDPRHVGLIEEVHHNTYDIEFWGPDGLCSSMYLGALTAMAALARDAGYAHDAVLYDELAAKGTTEIEKRLFNGKFYRQQVMIEGLNDMSFAQMLLNLKDDASEEVELLRKEGPRYQVGSGCLSDGVFGAWLAQLCGVKTPQNHESIRSHLRSVYAYNFKPNLSKHVNTQRPGYALGDESGLLLCSWPDGGKPTFPFIYSDEVWTGIEYQVASNLISEGMLEEGLSIAKSTRSRYDGRTRNPWNEYECGNFYARAMASYALLIAYSGFSYSAVTRALTISPRLDINPFECFFSTATGWGTFLLEGNMLKIKLQYGQMVLDEVKVERGGQVIHLRPNLTAKAGNVLSISLPGRKS